MYGNSDNYWARSRQQYPRRAFLRGAALTGAGLVGAFALACKSAKSPTSTRPTSTIQVQANQAGSLTGQSGRTTKQPVGETPARGGTYVDMLTANPSTLDPQNSASANTGKPTSAAQSRLFRFKTFWEPKSAYNKDIEPDLALSYESTDAQTWTFKLRQDAKFHNIAPVNGHPVTATDIKASFTRALAPNMANRGSFSMIDPAMIETSDDFTVVFKLNYPFAPFHKLVSSPIYSWILPREAGNGYDPAKQFIGSGPFVMENYQPDVAISFKRNPEWFEKDRPYVDGVKLAIVPDPAQRLAQFTGGNVDFGNPLQDEVPMMTQQNPRAEVVNYVRSANGIMYYQLQDPSSIFQDIRVRQAASLAVDRQAYGKVYYGDKYIRTFNVAPDFGKWAISWDELPQETKQWLDIDLQKAKQLMEAAGGAKLSIKMLYPVGGPADPLLKSQSETVFSMLKALPWDITYVPIDYNKDWQATGRGFGYGKMPGDSMAWFGLSLRHDVDDFIYGFWHSKGSTNISRLNDPRLDGMIDKARAIINDDERASAYKGVQRYLLDNAYSLTGMVNGFTYFLIQPRVRNQTFGDDWGPGAGVWGNLWLKS